MQLKFCVNINKTLEVIRVLVMTVFFVSPCIITVLDLILKRHYPSQFSITQCQKSIRFQDYWYLEFHFCKSKKFDLSIVRNFIKKNFASLTHFLNTVTFTTRALLNKSIRLNFHLHLATCFKD